MKTRSPLLWLAAAALSAVFAPAQNLAPATGIDLPVLGKVAPRAAKDIASSPWSIGAETLDRDFADYHAYKKFLGPLGAKGVRLQAGWAKCERVKGTYDFAWLDAIVDDAVAQGVRPWLEFSYGNTIYPGGGGTGLGDGFPHSPEALAAWDRWCRALVERYKDRVNQWEVWNEPDLIDHGGASSEAYVDLYIRTAAIVREVQPGGQVWALALASNVAYADRFLAGMKAMGKLDLVDAITFHGYPRNPDDTGLADRLRAAVEKHGRPIPIRQGETGATSKYQDDFALSKISFTETTHAKWNLRRLLAHHAKDVPMNLFTLSDLHYTQPSAHCGADGRLRMNYKGLVATNPDRSVAYVKPGYTAAQSLFAIFDDTLRRIPDFAATSTALRALSISGYRRAADGAQVVALWFADAPPADANGVSLVDVTVRGGKFTEPVLVDLRTSTVYALPKSGWKQDDKAAVFRALPVYDSPMLIAEKAAVGISAVSR